MHSIPYLFLILSNQHDPTYHHQNIAWNNGQLLHWLGKVFTFKAGERLSSRKANNTLCGSSTITSEKKCHLLGEMYRKKDSNTLCEMAKI